MAQIKIEITYDPSKETLEQAVSSLTPKARPVEPATTAEPVKKTETVKNKSEGPTSAATAATVASAKTEEPAAEAAATEKPAASPSETSKKVSKTDVRAVATALSKAGKREALSAIFAEFGGKKLSDIKEEDYPALMEKLEAANG